jgi:hypothetical protein
MLLRPPDADHAAKFLVHEDRLGEAMRRNAAHRALAESTAVDNARPKTEPHWVLPRPKLALHTHRRLAALHR